MQLYLASLWLICDTLIAPGVFYVVLYHVVFLVKQNQTYLSQKNESFSI